MLQLTNSSLPKGISPTILEQWILEHRQRTAFLQRLIARLEKRYNCTLAELEARLERGDGQEHPDWEDSIEWRNAVEMLGRIQLQEKLFVWLSH